MNIKNIFFADNWILLFQQIIGQTEVKSTKRDGFMIIGFRYVVRFVV